MCAYAKHMNMYVSYMTCKSAYKSTYMFVCSYMLSHILTYMNTTLLHMSIYAIYGFKDSDIYLSCLISVIIYLDT